MVDMAKVLEIAAMTKEESANKWERQTKKVFDQGFRPRGSLNSI